jgi:DNA-binding NtrC family response regulator
MSTIGDCTSAILDVLLVEGDDIARTTHSAWLKSHGCRVRTAKGVIEARVAIKEAAPDLAIIQLELPDGSGLALLRLAVEGGITDAVVLVESSEIASARLALDCGASDYLISPVDLGRLELLVEQSRHATRLRVAVAASGPIPNGRDGLGNLNGASLAMQHVYLGIERVSTCDETVFLFGGTGTGKEVAAQTIHDLSHRSAGPFVALNCSAISPTLLESEFFGHERGAFTGADKRRAGVFEQAAGGTLFLDELTELPIGLQSKLLRVLETRLLTRVGGNEQIGIDVRVLAASNCDPHEAVRLGKLREDLLYRLFVFPIRMPTLAERQEDVPVLAHSILDKLNRQYKSAKCFEPNALNALGGQAWPGNVRELGNVIRRAYIISEDTIQAQHLVVLQGALGSGAHLQVRRSARFTGHQIVEALAFKVGESIAQVEQRLLEATISAMRGDKQESAKLLGISLKTLYSRLNAYAASRETHAPHLQR